MNRFMKVLGGLLLASALAACGGGGGSAGTPTGGGTGTGTGGSTGGGGTTTTPSGAIALVIVNSAGASVSNIDGSGGYQARATVTNASGSPEAGKLVTFALADASIATLSPATALTNAAGVAQVSIAPASLTAVGAASLTATATLGTESITASRDFAVSASNLALSAITVGSNNLGSGGNTPLSVTALVNGSAASGQQVNVTFSTSCGRINSLTQSESVTTNGSGVAEATYTAVEPGGNLCSGVVTITASSAGTNPQTTTITVAAPTPNAVTFVSATPQQIFVAGSGAVEQSLVRFKVLSNGVPMQNEAVTFSFTNNPGGVGLGAPGAAGPVAATTDANGEATVAVFSGTIPGPVRVRATLDANNTVFSESQNLTVSSGPPSQRFMSLAVERFNIEGANIDGTATRLTVRVADRQGNPVENGTVVNFTAEGGQVAPSCATAQAAGISSCSVDFISQNPRPAGGRASVLAFTNGTKDYADNNANNRFDAGDTLIDIGDAYRDDDEDAVFDAGEFRVPRGGAIACAGAGAPFPRVVNTCDGLLATTVRQQTTILFSSTNPTVQFTSTSAAGVSFLLGSVDFPLLPMPAGTTVATIVNDRTNNAVTCTVTATAGSTVANVNPGTSPGADLRTLHQLFLKDCAATDQILIDITAPSGLKTTFALTLT